MNSKQPSTKVLLGLSGKSLSSVVAALLKHQGFQVIAVHFEVDSESRKEAERVAGKLGLQLIIEPAAAKYQEYITDHIVHRVLANTQPEPALMGHQKVLVEGLCQKAREIGCERIATGHSARVMLDPSTGLTRLVRASDAGRDQSHLLFGLRADELKQFILPAGDLNFSAVERLAAELELDSANLVNASPGFAFVAEDQFLAIAEPKIPQTMKTPGQIKTLEGSVVSDHHGLHRYRRGQGMPELKATRAEGFVVVGMVHGTHTLLVGPEDKLFSKEVTANQTNWVQEIDPIRGLACEVRLGLGIAAKARVMPFEHSYAQITFEEPQKNIIPGQAVIFYQGDEVLGGGFAV